MQSVIEAKVEDGFYSFPFSLVTVSEAYNVYLMELHETIEC